MNEIDSECVDIAQPDLNVPIQSSVISHHIFIHPILIQLFRFPKDTAEEQIAALSDEGYVTAHFLFHNALLGCLALTAFSLPKTEGNEKKA